MGLNHRRLFDGLAALVDVPVDFVVFVFPVLSVSERFWLTEAEHLQPTHHARSGEHGVVDRIGLYVAAPAHELDLDNNEVVDVLQILPESSLGESRIAATDHEVAAGSYADLASYVSRQDELTIVPADVHLVNVSDESH